MLNVHSFCFAQFLVSVVVVVALSSLVALQRKKNSGHQSHMRRFRSKKTDDLQCNGKRAAKSTSAGTHKEAR